MNRGYVGHSDLERLGAQLSERDQQIIELLGQLHLLSGQQIRRIVFEGINTGRHEPQLARRALLRLMRLGLLKRLERRIGGVKGGSDGFVYRLSSDGERLWRLRVEEPARGRQRPEPGERFLRHRLLVGELFVLLREAAAAGLLDVIAFQSEPECWRPFVGLGGQRQTLKPDVFLRLGVQDQEFWWFGEIDRGTVSQRTRRVQADAYRAYWRSGAAGSVMPRVLWVGEHSPAVAAATAAVRPDLEPTGLFVMTSLERAVTTAASRWTPGEVGA